MLAFGSTPGARVRGVLPSLPQQSENGKGTTSFLRLALHDLRRGRPWLREEHVWGHHLRGGRKVRARVEAVLPLARVLPERDGVG